MGWMIFVSWEEHLGKLHELLSLRHHVPDSRVGAEPLGPPSQPRSLRPVHELDSVKLLHNPEPAQEAAQCNVDVPNAVPSEEGLPFSALCEGVLQQCQAFSDLLDGSLLRLIVLGSYDRPQRSKPLCV